MQEFGIDSQNFSETRKNGVRTEEVNGLGEVEENNSNGRTKRNAENGCSAGLEEEKEDRGAKVFKKVTYVAASGSRRPSKRLSETTLKESKLPELFSHSQIGEERELMKFISKTPFGIFLQTIEEGRKNSSQLRAYKNFFVSLFESVLIMKRIEPLSEAELDTRMLSIPRPLNLRCTFE
eukprot:TRINITY_DN12673_c0_g1_i2.p1 TRINITY_DN12673_c0_g1~~TRINITY_DN12673_c0_g1_i2.p1  ORF type:complete len:179 (-),score=61.43 TRINITY_DN12673_c0_g1_i2:765-1301(-)